MVAPYSSKPECKELTEIDLWNIDPPSRHIYRKESVIEQIEKYGCGDDGVPLAMGRIITRDGFQIYREAVLSRSLP
jgi:hypothetical protein